MAMIWRGFYFYRRRMDRRRVLRALAFLLMALALTVLFIAATQMRPLLESMATTRVSNTVTRIVSEAVYEAIEKEKRQYVPTTADFFDYNRSLNEMTREIVKVVLSQCGGNQTLAAKRLGIGRTTLWRYLNEEK